MRTSCVILFSRMDIAGPQFVINPQMRKVNYHPLTNFEPICHLVSSPTVIVVNSTSSYRTLADLLEAHAPSQAT